MGKSQLIKDYYLGGFSMIGSKWTYKLIYRVFREFFQEFSNFCSLSRHHRAAIGCAENVQLIGVAEHSHCAENFCSDMQASYGLKWVVKKHNFSEHLYVSK